MMSALNLDEIALLQRAGFTDRQISDHRQKFYNLFRVAPISTRDVEQLRASEKLMFKMRTALSDTLPAVSRGWPHVFKTVCEAIAAAEQAAEKPDADGWIRWHGGEGPLKQGQSFQVLLRSGMVRKGDASQNWCWLRNDPFCDHIVAYRIVQEGGAA